MFTPKNTSQAFTRIAFWTIIIILAILAKILVPANRAAGATYASPLAAASDNPCAAFSASAQAANAQPLAVRSPDEEVNVPAETVNQALYHMAWMPKDDLQRYVYNGVMDTLLRYSNLDKGADEYVNYANAVEARLKLLASAPYELVNANAIVNIMLDTALETPAFAKFAPNVWNKLKTYEYTDVDASGTPLDRIVAADAVASSARGYRIPEGVVRMAEEASIELYDCAQQNPAVAKIVDAVHSKRINVSVRDSAKTIIAKNPQLPVLKEITDRLGEDGSINISLNELNALTKAEFGKLNTTLDQIQTKIKDIDERQKVIVDYLSNQAEKQAEQEQKRKEAEAFAQKISASQAGLSILTTITAQFSPQRAKQLSVTGSAVIQTVVAVNNWLKATAGQDALGKVFSLSSVVMTGNVLSAAMSVVSLFGPQEPPIEQTILEEIGKLREQVNELRVEMHERFDRIDTNLNTIYTTMQQRFDQIDVQLGRINGNILEVQRSLTELDVRLSRIERNNFEFLNDLGRRPLLDAINGGLGYQQRTGQPMPYQPDFVNFENTIHGWGTIHAFDSVNAGPTQRDYSDAQMLAELSAYPTDANINYINGWLQAHGMPAISNKRLPSPRDWLFAVRTYNRLALEWPQHMTRIDPQRQVTLNQIGLDIEAAMRNLSTVTSVSTTVTGTVTNTVGNRLLYTSVISHYQGKLDTLNAGIASVENNFMNEVRVNRLGRAEPFDLHGYLYQPLTYRTPEVTVATCGSPDHYSYKLFSGFEQRIPNFELYNLADYLKVGKLQACVYDQWYDIIQECKNGECYDVGNHNVGLNVTYNYVVLMSQTLVAPRMRIPQYGLWIKDNWDTEPYNYRHAFEVFKQLDPLTPAQQTARQQSNITTRQAVESELYKYQHELYGRIQSEMSQGALKPLVTQVAGSKALLETIVALGLPRAASNDEFLHAMLYGNQQLVDEKSLTQNYALKMAQPVTQTNFIDNPRFMLGEVAGQRREIFGQLLDGYLNAITTQAHSEQADYIADARRSMAMTMRVVKIQSEVNVQRIFLPMINR